MHACLCVYSLKGALHLLTCEVLAVGSDSWEQQRIAMLTESHTHQKSVKASQNIHKNISHQSCSLIYFSSSDPYVPNTHLVPQDNKFTQFIQKTKTVCKLFLIVEQKSWLNKSGWDSSNLDCPALCPQRSALSRWLAFGQWHKIAFQKVTKVEFNKRNMCKWIHWLRQFVKYCCFKIQVWQSLHTAEAVWKVSGQFAASSSFFVRNSGPPVESFCNCLESKHSTSTGLCKEASYKLSRDTFQACREWEFDTQKNRFSTA